MGLLVCCCRSQVERRSRQRRSGGTRMSALASRHPLRLSTALTLVCPRYWSGGPFLNANYSALYVDKKCPFTGNVSIRGRILTGKVMSTKMNRTIIIRRDYLHYIPKYSASLSHLVSFRRSSLYFLHPDRYEKRHKNLAAHLSPAFRVEIGDQVTVGMLMIMIIGRNNG